MKNKLNSLAIGIFVLSASLLGVAAIVIFGASKFFEDDRYFASRFTETVNGLDVGAPVKFKGVKIGKVERIAIGSPLDSEKPKGDNKDRDEDVVIVHYSIDLNLLKRRMRETQGESGVNWIKNQIRGGLRAKLNYQSIVTGMLYVELDYFAQPDNNLHIHENPRFIGIPSESSGLSELMKSMQDSIASISQINFKELFDNTNTLIVNLNKKVDAIDTKGISDNAKISLAKIDVLLDNINKVAVNANGMVDNVDKTVITADVFMKNSDKNLTALTNDIHKTLSEIDKLVSGINSITEPTSPLRFELATLIRSLNNSMNSISNLTDYLQRNPNALLTGKSQLNSKEK